MKSLEDRWEEQKISDFHIKERKLNTEFTFHNTEVTDEDREAFKKLRESSKKNESTT